MNKNAIIVIIALIAIIGTAYALTSRSAPETRQGNIFTQADDATEAPDLTADLQILEKTDEGIKIEATITNAGPADLAENQTFEYQLLINEAEVLSNIDSYSQMLVGDTFSFSYTIPKAIYNYPESGEVSFLVDPENQVAEAEEGNNTALIQY